MVLFIDNTAAHAIITRGSAAEADLRAMAKAIRALCTSLDVTLWTEWVESKANVSDGPSRIPLCTEAEREDVLRLMKDLGLAQSDCCPRGY